MGVAGTEEFISKITELVELYRPDVVTMLNLSMNVIANCLEGSANQEELDFYLNRIRGSLDAVEKDIVAKGFEHDREDI